MAPFGRIGEPMDVASVAAFLASDDARWATGQNVGAGGDVFSAGIQSDFTCVGDRDGADIVAQAQLGDLPKELI